VLAGVLLTLFFTWNAVQSIRRARSKLKRSGSSGTPTFKSTNGVNASIIDYSVFFIMAGLIVEILSLLIMLCDRLKISEYDTHWQKGIPLINSWVCTKKW